MPSWFERFPGAAREIPRTLSASRDAPVLEGSYGPVSRSSVGIEFGTFRLHFDDLAVRVGPHFLVALENVHSGSPVGVPLIATQLWRGVWGATIAFSSSSFAERLFGKGAMFEIGGVFARETANATASFVKAHPFNDAPKPRDIPDGGSGMFLQADFSVKLVPHERVTIIGRLGDRLYVTGPIKHAPWAEGVITVRVVPLIVPFFSVYAERLLVNNAYDDGGYVRGLLGVSLPSKYGTLALFGGFDVGNGKGLLINKRGAHVSAGVRYAAF